VHAALIAAAAAYAWWATSLRPFTDPALVVVPAGGVAAMVLGFVLLRPRTAAPAPARGLAVWVGLVTGLAAWQLATFLQHPRDDHPTISSLTNTLFENRPVRALALLLWLAGAAALARRPAGRRATGAAAGHGWSIR
jgi:hypothetical protein